MSRIAKICATAIAAERIHSFVSGLSPTYKNWYEDALTNVKRKLGLAKTFEDVIANYLDKKEDLFINIAKFTCVDYCSYLYEDFSWEYMYEYSLPPQSNKSAADMLSNADDPCYSNNLAGQAMPIHDRILNMPTSLEERYKYYINWSSIRENKKKGIRIQYNELFMGKHKKTGLPVVTYLQPSQNTIEFICSDMELSKKIDSDCMKWQYLQQGFVMELIDPLEFNEAITGYTFLHTLSRMTSSFRIRKEELSSKEYSSDVSMFIERDLKIVMNNISNMDTLRRSYLLVGPPGTGKTNLIKNVIRSAPDEITIITVAHSAIKQIGRLSIFNQNLPIIVIIEDIDLLLSKDDVKQTVLNFLDGMSSPKKIIIIMTTNHPERVIGEIRDRPGRVDRIVYIGAGNKSAREAQLESIWKDKACPIPFSELSELTDGMTVASMVEMKKRAEIYSNFSDIVEEDTLRTVLTELKIPIKIRSVASFIDQSKSTT